MRHLQGVRQVQSTELQGFSEKDSVPMLPQSDQNNCMNKLLPDTDLAPIERRHCEAEGTH